MIETSSRLLAVRDGAPLLELNAEFRGPSDLDSAYRIADQLVAALEARHGRIKGYKVGATSLAGQRQLALAEPFYGRIPSELIFGTDVQCNFGATATIEPEIGFELQSALPPRSSAYIRTEVESAIGAVLPVFEINRPAYAKPFEVGGLCLIADNGVTQALILGNSTPYRGTTISLQEEAVMITLNGELKETGRGDSVLGDPILSLVWLVNALSHRGLGLREGDVIASGALCRHLPLHPGDLIEAQYSTLGRVGARIARG